MFHGLYNYSLSSNILSSYFADIVLLILIIRTYFVFKDLKKIQISKKTHKKYYLIEVWDVSKISIFILSILILFNYSIGFLA